MIEITVHNMNSFEIFDTLTQEREISYEKLFILMRKIREDSFLDILLTKCIFINAKTREEIKDYDALKKLMS